MATQIKLCQPTLTAHHRKFNNLDCLYLCVGGGMCVHIGYCNGCCGIKENIGEGNFFAGFYWYFFSELHAFFF
jgi:hypothetical protein